MQIMVIYLQDQGEEQKDYYKKIFNYLKKFNN